MGTNLVGQFHIDKSNLLKPNLHLVIGSRKKQSANKPKHFLLEKTGSFAAKPLKGGGGGSTCP